MKIAEKEIEFQHQKLILNNQRSLFWEAEQSLLISDLHLGKPAHFRKNGIAIPSTIAQKDLNRLENLIFYYQPKKLIVVGDFLHAGTNSEVEKFQVFRNQFPDLYIQLIKGNHDRIPLAQYEFLGINSVLNSIEIQNINLIHEPNPENLKNVICGHWHPGIKLRLTFKKSIQLPCFVVTENQMVLPAFSLFTGLDTNSADENSTFYAFDENQFFEFHPTT